MKILITGARSGIGYDVGRVLSFLGHEVYAGCHKEEEIPKDNKYGINFIKFDVTDENDYYYLDEELFDVVINMAAFGVGGKILGDTEGLRKTFEVNVFGTMNVVERYYKVCKENQKTGKVLIISSLIGAIPFPYLGKYVASKASLSILTKIMYLEGILEKDDFKICLVEPGAYQTGFNQVMINDIDDEVRYQKIRKIFQILEKKSNRSIVNRIVKMVESSSSKFYCTAPISQKIGVKLYQIFSL